MPRTEAQQGLIDAGLGYLFEGTEISEMIEDARALSGTDDVSLFIEIDEEGTAIGRSSTRQDLLNAFLRDAPSNTTVIAELQKKLPTGMSFVVISRGDDLFVIEFQCAEGLLS